MRTWIRQLLQRVLLIGLGLLLSLVATEIILQAGAAYVRATGRAYPDAWLTNRRRVMCLGDSNVYGVWVRRDQTFPHYLEEIWNHATPSQPVEVLNFGMPGLNSSKMRVTYRDLIARFRPDLVIVLVGVNDAWTVPVPIDDTAQARGRFRYALWERSRLFRLLSMIAARLSPDTIEVDLQFDEGRQLRGHVLAGEREFDLTATEPTQEIAGWPERLGENLRSLASDTDDFGAEFVVVSYATDQSMYGPANQVILGEVGHLNVIPSGPAFRSACPESECLYSDLHLRPQGYQLFAAIVWNGLRFFRLAPLGSDNATAFASLDDEVKERLEKLGYL